MIKRTLAAGAFAIAAMTGGASQAAVIDLGFIMDRSDSVSEANFGAAMDALADALESGLASTIGTADTYVVSVVVFNNTASDVVNRAVINSAGALSTMAATVRNFSNTTSGSTNYQAAFDQLRNNYADGELGAFSLVNMMTDGNPNAGNSVAGRDALRNAGWDSLSFEAVDEFGFGPDTATLAALGFDTGGLGADIIGDSSLITDPLNSAFVLELDNFGLDYTNAINRKVQTIVNPDPVPVPAALPLLVAGLGAFGFIRRRQKRA